MKEVQDLFSLCSGSDRNSKDKIFSGVVNWCKAERERIETIPEEFRSVRDITLLRMLPEENVPRFDQFSDITEYMAAQSLIEGESPVTADLWEKAGVLYSQCTVPPDFAVYA